MLINRSPNLALMGHVLCISFGLCLVVVPQHRPQIPVLVRAAICVAYRVVVVINHCDHFVLCHRLGDLVRQLQQSANCCGA